MHEQADLDFTPTAPFVPGSETSRDAALSIRHERGRLEALVMGHIRSAGVRGATDDEIEEACDLSHQTASARRRGLVLRGMVRATDETRLTRSKRKATVWVLASLSIGELPKSLAPSKAEIREALAVAINGAADAGESTRALQWLRDKFAT